MTNTDEQYGKVISRHRTHTRMLWHQFYIFPIWIALFIIWIFAFSIFESISTIPIIAVVWFIPLLFFWVGLVRSSGKPSQVDVYESGLLYSDNQTSKFIRWDEIDDIRSIETSSIDTTRLFRLFHQGKVILEITQVYRDYQLLAENVFEALLKQGDYQKVLDDGGTIECGPLTLSLDFVQANDLQISWSQIRDIRWQRRFENVTIRYDGTKSIKLDMNEALNVPIICAFMQSKIASEPKTNTVILQRNSPLQIPEVDAMLAEIQFPIEIRLKHRIIYIELAIGLIGLAVSLYTIIPGIQNAIAWDLINTRWFLRATPALIIPLISTWLIFVNAKLLYLNPRYLVTRAGLEVSKRRSKEMWAWEDILMLRIIFTFAWFVIPGLIAQVIRAPHKVANMSHRLNYPEQSGVFLNLYVDTQTPIFRRRLEQKETLHFGAVALDADGIEYQNKHYSWDEIDSVENLSVNWDALVAFKDSKHNQLFAVSIFQFENYDILLRLIYEKLNPPQAEEDSETD